MARSSNRIITCASCCQERPHVGRMLCSTCYQRHTLAATLDKYPPVRITSQQRYDDWVQSGLSPREYSRQIGILETSLCRALRVERERRDRLGLTWLTGWRKERGGYGRG